MHKITIYFWFNSDDNVTYQNQSDNKLEKLEMKLETIIKSIESSLQDIKDISEDDDIHAYSSDIESSLSDITDLFESMEEELEDKDETIEELTNEIEEASETPIMIYDKLKSLSESYHLSDHQIYQDDILTLLREEFNLNLVCLPAKNK